MTVIQSSPAGYKCSTAITRTFAASLISDPESEQPLSEEVSPDSNYKIRSIYRLKREDQNRFEGFEKDLQASAWHVSGKWTNLTDYLPCYLTRSKIGPARLKIANLEFYHKGGIAV